jgi:osmotically-inducible protein OsmY
VSAEDGVVILRGTVQTLSERQAAAEDAIKVGGAHEVDNRLKVNSPDTDQREDDEIRGVALQALMWNTDVPTNSVDVEVENAWVTLKGNVGHQSQSDAAYDIVASLYGVSGVINEIKVDER